MSPSHLLKLFHVSTKENNHKKAVLQEDSTNPLDLIHIGN